MRDYFATRYRLETAIENAYRIDGMQDYLDTIFCEVHEIPAEDEVGPAPYWLVECDPFTAFASSRYNDGTLKVAESKYPDFEPGAATLTRHDVEDADVYVEHVPGIWLTARDGEIVWREVDGESFQFVCLGTCSLPAETEHQSDDGGLCYEYRGDSHLSVLVKVEDILHRRIERLAVSLDCQ
jgi:hypothetical protein